MTGTSASQPSAADVEFLQDLVGSIDLLSKKARDPFAAPELIGILVQEELTPDKMLRLARLAQQIENSVREETDVADSVSASPTPLPGANWYATRRHLSVEWEPRATVSGWGSRGVAMCSTKAWPVGVYDQEAHDQLHKQFPQTKPVTVADLPLCKKCEKKGARRG